MKRFFCILAIIFCIMKIMAQIQISPYLNPALYNNSPTAANMLNQKLSSIVSANKIQSTIGDSRFILAGNWIEVSKDVVSSSPVQIAYIIEICLSIGDGLTGTKYISESFKTKGVGATEEKAHMNAIRNLQNNSTKLVSFIAEGKKRIINYYDDNKDAVLSNIHTLVTKENYDQAAYELSLIPIECNYYIEVQKEIDAIYQRIIDKEAHLTFTKVKAKWASRQDKLAADDIINILVSINPNATCYPDVQRFIKQVNQRISQINAQEWDDYKERQAHIQKMDSLNLEARREQSRLDAEVAQTRMCTNAEIEKERLINEREKNQQNAALSQQVVDKAASLESERINAVREIGIAYAKNHPKNVTYDDKNISSW